MWKHSGTKDIQVLDATASQEETYDTLSVCLENKCNIGLTKNLKMCSLKTKYVYPGPVNSSYTTEISVIVANQNFCFQGFHRLVPYQLIILYFSILGSKKVEQINKILQIPLSHLRTFVLVFQSRKWL